MARVNNVSQPWHGWHFQVSGLGTLAGVEKRVAAQAAREALAHMQAGRITREQAQARVVRALEAHRRAQE